MDLKKQKLTNGYDQDERAGIGNFGFGAVGSALDIPLPVLLRAAGAVQIYTNTSEPAWGSPLDINPFGSSYGDDPVDQNYINRGARYYAHHY